MAIIQAPGQGFDVLLETLLRKEQLAQQKEALKLQQQDFKLRQETAMAEQQQRKGEEEAAMLLLEQIGRNVGVDPSAAPALLGGIQRQQALDAEVGLTKAQTDNFAVQQELDRARLDLERRRTDVAEIDSESERRFREAQLALDERRLNVQTEQNRQALASQEFQQALQLGAASPQGLTSFMLEAYGEFTSPQDIQKRLASGEVEMSPRARLTRFLTGIGISADTQNTLNEALFTDGIEPQAVLESLISNPDVDDESKAQLTLALTSVFSGLTLPEPPPDDPGFWARIFSFLRGVRLNTPPPSGVRTSPTGA